MEIPNSAHTPLSASGNPGPRVGVFAWANEGPGVQASTVPPSGWSSRLSCLLGGAGALHARGRGCPTPAAARCSRSEGLPAARHPRPAARPPRGSRAPTRSRTAARGHAPLRGRPGVCGCPPPLRAPWRSRRGCGPLGLHRAPGRPSPGLSGGVLTDGAKAGLRGEGAEPERMGVLAADRKSLGSGREGLAAAAGRAGGSGVAGGSSRRHGGVDRQRDTHTRRLTVAGARGAGGPRRALTWQQRRRRRRHPRPGRSPRAPGLPPGGRAGGRRRPRGGGGDAGASDCWAEGTQLHQPTLGRSARLGRARSCSAPFGPARLGWGRGPRPPAQVASCARGAGL